MTERLPEHSDLPPDADPTEAAALLRIADRLARQRPVPRAAFRGDLRRSLAGMRDERPPPARLRMLIAVTGGLGTTLMLVGALSVVGLGPLAA